MAIREYTSLAPVVQSFALFIVEKRHDSLLIEHISFFADKWGLHPVDRLLEEFLVLSDEQFFDTL